LGKPVPVGVGFWTMQKASECITELTGQLRQVSRHSAGHVAGLVAVGAGGCSRGATGQARLVEASTGFPGGCGCVVLSSGVASSGRDARFWLGLAAKLVHQRWALVGKRPVLGACDEFKKEVVELYELLCDVERRVASISSVPFSTALGSSACSSVVACGAVGRVAHT